ncbi:MAG: hypothetical protein M3R68_05235, partial [Acidobacteriota bacterium]|nr:hypothetical protein [Acidobacteriota bacterium]
MKRWKKIVVVLLLLAVISQLPFAYRRYKLERLHAAIEQLKSQRIPNPSTGDFVEYQGVLHVHSFLGGHSTGTFEDLIAGAQANNLNFVGMTEHPAKDFDTAAMTLHGIHGGVLFVNGNELVTATHDRVLVLPGDERAASAGNLTTEELVAREKSKGALSLVAYPQDFHSWSAPGYDGVEVYNLFTNSRRINPVVMFFDALWTGSRQELLFVNFYERPSSNLKLWDDAMVSGRRLVATAGNDAHSNVGLSLNDSSGKKLIGIRLDPYERSFRLVRMHVLLPKEKELTADNLGAALGAGHCYIAFDLFSDATGFRFFATSDGEKKIAGDELPLSGDTRLAVSSPLSSRIVLYKNGEAVQERIAAATEFEVKEKGIYRVEVYL